MTEKNKQQDIPDNERWIYDNPQIIDSLRLSIQQAENGQVVSIELPELEAEQSEVDEHQ